jgi:site-specific recombinase XerD
MNKLTYKTYEDFENYLKVRKYSKHTIQSYSAVIYNYLEWLTIAPSKAGKNHIKQYFLSKDFKSNSSQNRYVSALKLYYRKCHNKAINMKEFERPRKDKKLPRVVDKEVMLSRINAIKNLKHKAILQLTFSTTMRVSDIQNLKITDIDSARMLIHIKSSKGRKDRFNILTEPTLLLLRTYYKAYRPKSYLFEGEQGGKYSYSSLSRISNRYLGVNFHGIRHSSATAYHENGMDIRALQFLLGHGSVKTTEIYTHVSIDKLQRDHAPI